MAILLTLPADLLQNGIQRLRRKLSPKVFVIGGSSQNLIKNQVSDFFFVMRGIQIILHPGIGVVEQGNLLATVKQLL